MDIRDRFVQLIKDFDSLYNETGLCGISCDEVQMDKWEDLTAMFPDDILLCREKNGEYPHELSVSYQGVKFLCILDNTEYHDYCDRQMFNEPSHTDEQDDERERQWLHDMGQGA